MFTEVMYTVMDDIVHEAEELEKLVPTERTSEFVDKVRTVFSGMGWSPKNDRLDKEIERLKDRLRQIDDKIYQYYTAPDRLARNRPVAFERQRDAILVDMERLMGSRYPEVQHEVSNETGR